MNTVSNKAFGTIHNVVTSITTGNTINDEVNNLVNEAHSKIGQHEAMMEWVNNNLHSMPTLVDGDTEVEYKDDRENLSKKMQNNSRTLWVLALDVLGFNKHVNGKLLAATFYNWSNEFKAGMSKELSEELGIDYVKAMQELNIISKQIEQFTTTLADGQVIKVNGSGMTEEFTTTLNELVEPIRERQSMVCKPLKHQPLDWTDSVTGVAENANLRLIKGSRLKRKTVATKVLDAVNKLQAVRFIVAPCIIEAAKDMRKNKHLFTGVQSKYFNKKELTSEAFRIYEEVLKYQSNDGYYFPITLDTRGRMYYRGGLLSPQGIDFCKAAFQFANKLPLGDTGFRAICIHTANVFGYDKASIQHRVEWVQTNWDRIVDCKSHRDVRKHFKGADVFQALVAANEIQAINAWSLTGLDVKEFESGLVCHQDGTCNGLQHMAAITGDRATAVSVNCVASAHTDTPTDIYGLVYEEALKHTDNDKAIELMKKYARDMAKNPVMVTGYGATESTIKRNTAKYLAAKKEYTTHATVIAESYLSAIDTVAGAVTQLTESIKICVNDALLEQPNKTKFTWVTADGFVACTEYRETEEFRVRAGKLAARMRGLGKSPLDAVKTAGAMSPNLVHSIDSTHCRMVVRACEHDLVTVHDSIGSHPSTYFTTSRAIREKFVLVHSYDALGDLCEGMNQQAPEFEGDYEAKEALQSAYIFS